jgi:hypothetical protein
MPAVCHGRRPGNRPLDNSGAIPSLLRLYPREVRNTAPAFRSTLAVEWLDPLFRLWRVQLVRERKLRPASARERGAPTVPHPDRAAEHDPLPAPLAQQYNVLAGAFQATLPMSEAPNFAQERPRHNVNPFEPRWRSALVVWRSTSTQRSARVVSGPERTGRPDGFREGWSFRR